jgi:RNA polymerase sigma factor (sigma-70 family)
MATDPCLPQANDDFEALLLRVRRGDETAVGELIRRYERAVLRSVRSRLGSNMRRAMDSMDVMQSVHRSLLVGIRSDRFQLNSPQQLVALAIVMVQRKVARHWRKLKRIPISGLEDAASSDATPLDALASSEPTPSEVAATDDLLELFLSQLDEFDQHLVRLKLDGHSSVETADILGRDAAFVRMRWARLRQRLRERGPLGQ